MSDVLRIPTTPDLVLLAIQSQLVNANAFTASTVFIVTDKKAALNIPPSTLYGTIVPGRFRPDPRSVAGAGRSCIKVTMDVTISILANIQLDQGDRADAWLTNSAGIIAQATTVMDCLQLNDLLSEDGTTSILSEPMRLVDGDVTASPGKFGELALNYEVKFQWGLPTVTPIYG